MREKKKYLLLIGGALALLPLLALKNNSYLGAINASVFAAGEDSLVNVELKQKAIYNDDFVRKTFYTWTSLEEVNQVRGNKVLLIKSKSETKGYSLFDLALRDSSFKNNPVAKVLCEDRFAKKRFAWPNAWATVMGWETEKYGEQLIKVVLKDDAIIGMFNETDKQNPFTFYDMKGNRIGTTNAILQKEKIAAMYHVGLTKSKRSETNMAGTYINPNQVKSVETLVPYREYVILNASMIKFWAYGTDDILTEMSNEVALLDKVRDFCKNSKGKGVNDGMQYYDKTHGSDYFWRSNWKENNSVANYFACICFQNDFYLLNKSRIDAIISAMKKCIKAQAQPITGN
jgi:hypothetical protein